MADAVSLNSFFFFNCNISLSLINNTFNTINNNNNKILKNMVVYGDFDACMIKKNYTITLK